MQLHFKINDFYIYIKTQVYRFFAQAPVFKIMKPKLLVTILYLVAGSHLLHAQDTSGITGKPDSSYTTFSAYQQTIKTHPFIKIVPRLQKANISEARNIVYCKLGDRKLVTDVFAPKIKGDHKLTAIIMIHGGGWRSGNRAQHYPLAQHLAVLGYVCFTPEYRLSTEALFPAGIYDIKAMIRWVRKNAERFNIDTSKIVAAGFSAGGEMAAFMGTTGNMPEFEGKDCNPDFGSQVNAVIDIDGTLSFVHPDSREGDDSKRISAGTYWFGYSKAENPKLWEAASPLTHVSAQSPSTLFINSSVPWMHAGQDEYCRIVVSGKKYCEIDAYENAPHSFCLFDPWFDLTVSSMDKFLKNIFPIKNK